MLRNGVTPIPPAIQICRRAGRSAFENEPNGPSTIGLRAGLEAPEGARVVADRLDGDRRLRSSGAEVIENGWNWLPISPARNENTWRSIEMSNGPGCALIAGERKLTKTNWPGS